MKRFGSSLAALAFFGLAATTYAGDMVPFRARGPGQGTIVSVSGPEVEIFFEISLLATHLGNSTGTADYFLNTDDLTFHGHFCVTGSNGKNTVCFDATDGQLSQPPNPPDPNLFDLVQTVTVNSKDSAGAFENAIGSAHGTGQFNMQTLFVTAQFDGTISRPNSR